MKSDSILVVLLLATIVIYIACRPSIETPLPIPNSLTGKWNLTDTQRAGNGMPGAWATASPAGQWIEIQPNGQVSGTAFPSATTYMVLDSITVKLIDASQQAGFHLFNYKIDTVARTLLLSKRPPDGVSLCFEGCGGYRFGR